MGAWWDDLRHGGRVLLRSPGFAAAAVLTLGVGIGANTAIFSMVNGVLLRPLPFADPERLVWLWLERPDGGRWPFSLPDFADHRDGNRTLEGIAAFGTWNVNLTGAGDPERLLGLRVTGNLFHLLGVEAAIGRALTPGDDAPASPRAVVITHGLWMRRFGGDPGVVGRALVLNGEPITVVGVLPPDFFFPIREAEVATALVPDADPWRYDRRTVNFLRLIGRMKHGVTPGEARADLTALALRLRQEFPETNATKAGVLVVPLHAEIVKDVRLALWVLLGAVGIVLLIACGNLSGLLMVRASARQREMAVRAALGATRGRLMRTLFAESILLAAAGGALATILASWGADLLMALSPADLPRAREVRIDGGVLLFTAGLAALAILVMGLAPALLARAHALVDDLKGGGRGATDDARRRRARGALVVAEVALSLVLLAGAGLFLRSFLRLQEVDPGFEPRGLLIGRLSLPRGTYGKTEDLVRFHDRVRERLSALPGVESAGLVSLLPMGPGLGTTDFWRPDRPPVRLEDVPNCNYRIVGPGYFRTMRIALKRGREFDDRDRARAAPVVLVNETLATRHFPGEDPVGRPLTLDDRDAGPRTVQIVGVVADVKQGGLDAPPFPDVYLPLAQLPEENGVWLTNNQFWAMRVAGDPESLAPAFRREIGNVDHEVAASNVRAMDGYMGDSVSLRRFSLVLVGAFALAALALAAMGLYALISYTVALREREIGIRMALGARRGDVIVLVVGQGLRLTATGVALGVAGALALTRLLRGLLFGTSAADPATFAVICLVLGAVALLAAWLPARRAGGLDPSIALRAE